ncbi:prominin-2 [Hoplias malabaricus]|uniref:prominin-2 n=1 Tax=Hoplias malabaricus TaxID=27720 RepID=UPI0034631243
MGSAIRRHVVGVFCLLLLVFWPCINTQMACPVKETPPLLETPGNLSAPEIDFGSGFMSSFVHSFLQTVQPNPFPEDLFKTIVNSKGFSSDFTKEILRYEAGFLVCVAIGILYILLMPLIGLFFACCRCCGKCGGRMYQKQTNSIRCKRRSIYTATLLTTIIILVGNICMFLSNKYTDDGVNNGVVEINSTFQDLQNYISTISTQVNQVMNESTVTVDEITCQINGSGLYIGEQIQDALNGTIKAALDSITKMAQVVNRTSILLPELNTTQSQLQTKLGVLQTNLTLVRDRINTTLHNPNCTNCDQFQSKLASLSLDTSFNLPSLSELQSAVNRVNNADLNAQIKKGQDYFDGIPQQVTNETRDSIQGAQNRLQGLKSQISNIKQQLPLNFLTDISETLRNAQYYTNQYTPIVKTWEQKRWIVALVLSFLILLVVVCNLLGLLLGPAGLKPNSIPTDRSGTANCGGLFLMAGVGFSFIFSWIFMIIVLVLFILGGNIYTLICVPWQTRELYKLIDTPGILPEIQISGLGSQNLTVTGLYNSCHANMPLWETLHLEKIIDLNVYLNVSQYTAEIKQAIEKSNINIPGITLLSPDTQNQLRSFSSSVNSLNFSSVIQKMNTFSKTNLNLTADELDQLANVQTDANVKRELSNNAKDLRNIQTQINLSINPLMLQLNSTINNLIVISSQISGTVGTVLQNVGYAQMFLNNNLTQIVKSKAGAFTDREIMFLTGFANWVNQTITKQVGRCGPVAAAVDMAEKIICVNLVDSLNAFWFCFGWCMIFLIPSIIFSVKLAKYYRRMKHADVFENNIMMDFIPRATMKPY